MLATYTAICLLTKKLKRIPSKTEHTQIINAVQEYYKNARRAQPACINRVLEQLRSNSRVIDIVDVTSCTASLSKPHSFVEFGNVLTTLKQQKSVVCPAIGTLMYFKKQIIISNEFKQVRVSKSKLKQLLNSSRIAATVISFA